MVINLVQTTQTLIKEFLDTKNVFAVIGASNNTEKYGHKIYFDLKHAGYTVYPVNPHSPDISGDQCYPNLQKLPVLPDVVDLVVPPKVTEATVKECQTLGIKKIWMQPGSESDEAISFCHENNMKVLHDVCVMMERRKKR